MGLRQGVASVLSRAGRALARVSRGGAPSAAERRVQLWFAVDGDRTLRLDYPLDARSIVLDLGGYQGQWAGDIHARYGCTVHVFEPVPDFAAAIERRFEGNSKIMTHTFGLGAAAREIELAVAADGTSAFRAGGHSVRGRIERAADWLESAAVARVDLAKINIEGGEFELLEHLLDAGLVARFVNIQVQFHDVIPGARARMHAIQRRLAATHELTWQYEFVWENWRRRGA